MGNNKSTLAKPKKLFSSKKQKNAQENLQINDTNETNQLTEVNDVEDVEDVEISEQDYYTNDDDIDRQHSQHFFRKHIFKGKNFSAPIEENLIQGCKALDVG